MGKLPAIQFYPGDWLRDDVSGCSLTAQGLWLRMMILMHDAERYGYLIKDGMPIPPESIARRCGCTPEQYMTLLDELFKAGVPSRTAEGVIFSRRMVRDEEQRAEWRKRKRKQREVQKAGCHADVTPMSEDEDEVVLKAKPKNKSSSEDFNSAQYARKFCEEHAICGTQPFDAVKCALEFIVRDEDVGLPAAFTALSDRLRRFRADPNQYKGSEKNWFEYGKYRRPKPVATTRYNAFAELDREREEALRRREAEKRASAN